MSLNRTHRTQTGHATVDILTRGSYSNAVGELVAMAAQIAAAREGTLAFPPETANPTFHNAKYTTHYEVRNESTFSIPPLIGISSRPSSESSALLRRETTLLMKWI